MHSFSPEMMRQIILMHYETPYHKETPQNTGEFHYIHLNSTGCIDDIHLYLKINHDIVETGYFDGIGCTISIASTSILLSTIEGKKLNDVLAIIHEYKEMINGRTFKSELLDEALVFINTAKQPSRIKCATLSWDGAAKLIHQHEESK